MDKCIIIGAGTYGQVYAEYLIDSGKYIIVGFLDDDKTKHGIVFNGISVLGELSFLEEMHDRQNLAVFAPLGNNEIRTKILRYAQSLGCITPNFIHSSAEIHESVQINSCVYILPSTNIMPHSILEDYVMISMGVNIAHHSKIGEGSFLSQGVNVGASVAVGNNSFLGIASTIMTGVNYIGTNSVVGAGAVVINDVPDNATVVGVPARIIKQK